MEEMRKVEKKNRKKEERGRRREKEEEGEMNKSRTSLSEGVERAGWSLPEGTQNPPREYGDGAEGEKGCCRGGVWNLLKPY